MRSSILLLFLALSATPVPATAAQATSVQCVRAPCPNDRPLPMAAAIERTSSVVRVTVDGPLLRYVLTERYRNRGHTVGEADYLLPLPRGAAFEALALTIDGEPVTGEAMDAARARSIYEAIVRQAKDPALVEWMDHDLFRTRIFPIAPGEERTVEVRFTVVARREGHALRVEHLTGGRSAGAAAPQAPAEFTLLLPADDRFGTPYSPTHQLDLRPTLRGREVRVRGDASRLTLLLPVRDPARAVMSTLVHAPGDEDAFVLVTVTPPAGVQRQVPRDVTLVLDVSGSMAGTKLAQAKAAGRAVLATLAPTDRVRVIAFASDVDVYARDWSVAHAATRRAVGQWIDALVAEGGTNIEAALQQALEVQQPAARLGVVLFLTDGAATVGERSAERLAAQAASARGRQRVFTFGVGADVQAAMLERIALDGKGTAQFLQPSEDVEHAVGVVAQRLTAPVATDLKVRATGVTLRHVMPGSGIDLFAGQNLVVVARVRGSGRATLILEGQSPAGPVRWTETIVIPARSREHAAVAKLWAVQRVGWLSAERRRAGASVELDDELRALGLRYGIPTELSSYLVLEPGMTVPTATPPRGSSGRGVADGRVAQSTEFAAAKTASAQRAATTLADAAPPRAPGASTGTVGVADRSFVLSNGRWTDTRVREGLRRVSIAPYSAAYFALIDAIPELRGIFALGEAVTVAGRAVVLVVAADGVTTMDAATRAALVRDW